MTKKPKTLEITSSRSFASLLSGRYRSKIHWSGIEFSDLREYFPGDDVRAIDWKTSARTGHVHVKRFREERAMPVWFGIDVGASMRIASGSRTKIETAFEAFWAISEACVSNRDPYGVVLYRDRVDRTLPPLRGESNRLLAKQMLEESRVDNGSKALGDLSDFFAHLRRMRVVHSLVFVFCDEIEQLDTRTLRALAQQNDIVFVTILDAFEWLADISGVHHLVDVRGHDLVLSSNNKNARKRFASIRHARLEAFSRALRTAGARHLILDDRSDVFREFDRFFQLPLHG